MYPLSWKSDYFCWMSEEIFYPIEEAEKLVAQFMDCSLPADEWDHGGHLVMGLYMIAHHGDTAFAEIRKHLNLYVNSLGKDCLLYTSPSPRDATLSRMPSSA